jgi:hypothetical protein
MQALERPGVSCRHCLPILTFLSPAVLRGREAGVCSAAVQPAQIPCPVPATRTEQRKRTDACHRSKRLQRPRSISISQSHRSPSVPEQQWQHPRVVSSRPATVFVGSTMDWQQHSRGHSRLVHDSKAKPQTAVVKRLRKSADENVSV